MITGPAIPYPPSFSPQVWEESKPSLHGAGLVFFSGGTALNETAKALSCWHPSTHIITTFDSGGSTAKLRKYLEIPAVGDIRSRLLALADDSRADVGALKKLMSYRLSEEKSFIARELEALRDGSHPTMLPLASLWAGGERWARQMLADFMDMAGDNFDYAGASVGNLLLAMQYFQSGKNLQRAVDIVGRYLHIRGRVIPVSETPAHLAVALKSGETLVGQHRFTGKWEQEIQAPIAEIWLVKDAEPPYADPMTAMCQMTIEHGEQVGRAIASAQCLCFPIGSFFSSVVANLLVGGVGRAIASATCPKVFVPNPGADPELLGFTLLQQVECILDVLQKDAPHASPDTLLNRVVIDRRGAYVGGVPSASLKRLGIEVLEARLLDEKLLGKGTTYVDGDLLAQELLRLHRLR